MKFKLLLLTLVAMLGLTAAHAAPPSNGGENKKTDIAGGVIDADTRKPLSNVYVSAYASNKKEKVVMTDGNGAYAFNDLKPGTYKLVFEKDGFRKVTKEKVVIRADDGCQLNVELEEAGLFQILPGLLLDYE